MENRNSVLDSIRGIAMLGIIWTHFSQFFPTTDVAIHGARGVQIMYIVTGYLIPASLEKSKQKGESDRYWVVKKIINIVPMYWFFSALFLLVVPEGNEYWMLNGELTKLAVVCNFLCLHGFVPYYMNSINLNWYIGNLIILYFISPILIRRVLYNLRIGTVFSLCYISGFVVFGELVAKLNMDYILFQYLEYLWLPAQMPCILAGVLCYYLMNKSDFCLVQRINRDMFWPSMILLVVSIASFCVFSNQTICIFNTTITWAIIGSVLLLLLMERKRSILINNIFSAFGKYSLGIYLSHYILIQFLSRFFIRHGVITNKFQNIIMLICVYCAVLLVGIGTDMLQKKIVDNILRIKIFKMI